MGIVVKIDTKGFENYRKSLTTLSKSAIPTAVRNTLNNTGFDMKKEELHKSAQENFKYTRSKHFYKRFSFVGKAYGRNINTMETKVGLRDLGQQSAKDAVENAPLHETGGIVNKGNMYLDGTRVSNQRGRLVRIKQRLKKGMALKKINASYTKKAMMSYSSQKPFWHRKGGRDFLIQIKSLKRQKGKSIKFKTMLLMMERKNAKIKKNKFVFVASERSSNKIPKLFDIELQKQLDRYVARKQR